MKTTTLITTLLVLIPMLTMSSVIKVPADRPNIQAAIDASVNGDTVLVSPGIYLGPGNREISYRGKKLVVKSVAGPETTIIDCLQTTRAFEFETGDDTTCVLDGFTIRNGYRNWEAGAVLLDGGSALFVNCIFKNNLTKYGGAVYAKSGGTSYFRRCSFIDNQATEYGGAVFCQSGSTVDFEECLFLSNNAKKGGAIATRTYGTVRVASCTFVDNPGSDIPGLHIHSSSDSLFVTNSVFAYGTSNTYIFMVGYMKLECTNMFGNTAYPYGSNGNWVGLVADQANINGNFSANPQFCDTANGNFFLEASSPGMPNNNECNTLVGAYGLGCDFVCGDISNDGITDETDLNLLLELYFSDTLKWPIYWPAADLNCDKSLRLDDIILLVDYISGSGVQPCCGN